MSKLAILGGTPVRSHLFPSWPIAGDCEKAALSKVVEGGGWGMLHGATVAKFAQAFAEFHGAKFAVPCASGTAGLEIQLRAAGVGEGDEVIIPAYTFFATAIPILAVRAVPVIVDIDPQTYCIDVDQVESAITSRTRAIVPVHLYCSLADLDGLTDVANRHGLVIIEDCAHVPGSLWRNKSVGRYGISGSFSFQESKPLTSGEGGVIITDNERLYEYCESYVNCGRTPDHYRFHQRVLGWNYRMTSFQAAVLLCQLERLPEQLQVREQNALHLSMCLEAIEGAKSLYRDPRITRQTYYKYVFKLEPSLLERVSRSLFIAALEAEGIPCRRLFVPLYKDPLFVVEQADWLPRVSSSWSADVYRGLYMANTERAAYHEAVGLWHTLLLGSRQDVEDIAGAIAKVCEQVDELGRMNLVSNQRQ